MPALMNLIGDRNDTFSFHETACATDYSGGKGYHKSINWTLVLNKKFVETICLEIKVFYSYNFDRLLYFAFMKIVKYISPLGLNGRRCVRHCKVNNIITEFVIQYEIEINNEWYPVVRYDTAHGFAHKDIINYKGKIKKMPLPFDDYNVALTYAEKDLRNNWTKYRDNFLKEINNE